MKYLITFIIFLALTPAFILPQSNSKITIKGNVTDEKTSEPLDNASVFLENTTMGTRTQITGEFIIRNIPFGSYNLVISYVGYETQTKQLSFYKDSLITVDAKLKPVQLKLKEVNIISTQPTQWKKYLEIFTKEFIGSSDNAFYTKIINPEVIEFKMDEDKNILHASSDSVIIVENKALGYRLYIWLASAEYSKKDEIFTFSTHTKFEELGFPDKSELKEREENRRDCYLGSVRHFIKALFQKRLDKEGFSFFSGSFDNLKSGFGSYSASDQFELTYNNDSTTANFYFDKSISVSFSNTRHKSILTFPEYYIVIDKFGNILRPSNVFLYGYWGNKRVADMLPHDYIYKEK
jgi:hypothetical protein